MSTSPKTLQPPEIQQTGPNRPHIIRTTQIGKDFQRFSTTQPRPLCWYDDLPDLVASPYWRDRNRQALVGRKTRRPVARRNGERGGCFTAGGRRATEGLSALQLLFPKHGDLLSVLNYGRLPNSLKELEFD